MWLLHSGHLQFKSFFDAGIPRYAILSHRWGNDEVSFQDLQAVTPEHTKVPDKALTGARFSKIQHTRNIARNQGIEWIWVDTCCIDKKSSAELSEAINSMFQWYQRAAVCYVYMSDVSRRPPSNRTNDQSSLTSQDEDGSFQNSSWFSRGWTLQELLAPRQVNFYDREWTFFGERKSLSPEISRKTGIELRFLDGSDSHKEACIAQKMSWVSERETTRKEDMAYCLLGLFNVNMPLLYGEGNKAFLRLQLEIIKQDDDESIFAWTSEDAMDGIFYPSSDMIAKSGMLATTPRMFAGSKGVSIDRSLVSRPPYSMTNKGLQFRVNLIDPHGINLRGHITPIKLNCRVDEHSGECNHGGKCKYGGQCKPGVHCKHTKQCIYGGKRAHNAVSKTEAKDSLHLAGTDCWTCRNIESLPPSVTIYLMNCGDYWHRVNFSGLAQRHKATSISREAYFSDWHDIYIRQARSLEIPPKIRSSGSDS